MNLKHLRIENYTQNTVQQKYITLVLLLYSIMYVFMYSIYSQI